MRTPFKVMWAFIIGIVGLVAYSSFNQQYGDAGAASDGTATASEANTAGWASSADIFKQRWNSEIEVAYRINDFRVDGTGKNGGNFPAGTVYAVSNTFMLTTHNRDMFASLCVQTTEASLGIPLDDAVAVVKQAVRSLQSSPNAYGLAEIQGYDVAMQIFASSGELDCTISPKAP